MGKKKKNKKHLTIEGQLERHYLNEKHTERNEVLWHAWCQNKRWLSQLLEATMSSFPTYSKHDESHANTVLHNIEMILGENRIGELSASDCFMLLHTVYIHDIGMVITHTDREEIVKNEKFLDMVKELGDENDVVFQKAVKALQQTKYEYDDEDSKEEQMKKLYADKLSVYYGILHLIANFRRTEHGNMSEDRLTEWTLKSEKLGTGFSMAGIPQRIFLLIAKCAGLHTDSDFEHIMNLPQEDNGYVSDYLHPRFVAVLLQLGDILDMDNDRFHPLTKEFVGVFPELSERHYEKHQAIRRLYIRPDIISIEADCSSQEALRLVRKECDILKSILKEAGYNWMLICPRNFSGALPTVDSVKLYLDGMQIPEELVATQFHISQSKAFAILEGSNVYKGQFVFLREFLQNAIDASKMQYWQECVRTWGYYRSRDELKKMSPDELENILSTDIFPIEIEMQIIKRNERRDEFPITEEDFIDLRNKKNKEKWQYGVKVRIKDFGTGIDKESILNIAKVGNSRKRDRHIITDMPEWLKPTAEFGIGLQSAFILTNIFKCYTFTRSNEKYEVTFSTVKSNYYEGYINVKPRESFNTKDDAYGTCFEVFVPAKKKMRHELYPAAWDGKDYFDQDYEVLRPLRHSAELLAQMALYLDEQIGEQLFPIHLKVESVPGVVIPLNLSDKNQLKRLKCNLRGDKTWYDDLKDITSCCKDDTLNQFVQNTITDRAWNRSGKSWIFYYNKGKDTNNYKNNGYCENILIEKTDRSIALLDCWNTHFYFWDNELCTFCIINMKNFLKSEQRETERLDGHCENKDVNRGVLIYYKGIELDEIELPDFGNELIQSIDIKGKLAREYINLSRKGFTEKGKVYFLREIYEPLLESVHEILRAMNKNQPNEVTQGIENSLKQKKELFDTLPEIVEAYNSSVVCNGIVSFNQQNTVFTSADIRRRIDNIRERIIELCKENIVIITMLAFFAQKGEFNPLFRLSCDNGEEARCCWNEALECAREYGKWLQNELQDRSVLFKIEHRPEVNLQKMTEVTGYASGVINFSDVFSNDNRFMIVSKRENVSAPWKQFLTPIYIKREVKDHEDPIDILKQYILTDSFSKEKKELEEKLQKIGQRALKIATYYGMDDAGVSGEMSPGEYLQQYFLKWMLKYIPTVALFMSDDGNIRINIICGKIFPFIFVNQSFKVLVVKRILEDAKRYGIQRFSIPAWQKMEYLKCKELPYTHYFVKRGYMARESYGKLIFPFGAEELKAIMERMNSPEARNNSKKLNQLFGILNVEKYLSDQFWIASGEIDRQIKQIQEKNSDIHKNYIEIYGQFKEGWKSGNRQALPLMVEVREEYRSFTLNCIRKLGESQSEDNLQQGFQLKNITEFREQCSYIIACILLKVIGEYYGEDLSMLLTSLPEKRYALFVKGWMYVIKREYMADASETAKYKIRYLEILKNERSKEFYKQQMILDYIALHNSSGLLSKHLWNCWLRCFEELFDVFTLIEMNAFRNPYNDLPDLEYFEKKV
ncbi:HD domain-containing protein [Bariatricus sp. SGI.154]|uniref:HD domain-containing protein n=1 Tax=Bariatricus sp. SGI.154 TaxID=3420549 RepID=UPI003D00566C